VLRTHLDPRTRSLLVDARVPSGDVGQLVTRARAAAAGVAVLEEEALVDEVLGGLADGRGCVGAAPTLRAIAHGRAREVLVAPDAADRRGVRRLPREAAGATPIRRAAGVPAGHRHGHRARLSDVLVRAAGATSTVVRTVRDGRRLDGGVGALLRDPADVPSRALAEVGLS
jgi:hypothetical protein